MKADSRWSGGRMVGTSLGRVVKDWKRRSGVQGKSIAVIVAVGAVRSGRTGAKECFDPTRFAVALNGARAGKDAG